MAPLNSAGISGDPVEQGRDQPSKHAAAQPGEGLLQPEGQLVEVIHERHDRELYAKKRAQVSPRVR